MTRTTIPLTSIIVIDRQRRDLGDIDSLADSIKQYGLIQPIVINQANQLIAGGRRLAAHQKLGLLEIDVVYKETIAQDELHEMELEENIRRKAMTWQEECRTVLAIHRIRERRSAKEGWVWGQRRTGEMLGLSLGNVNYNLVIAKKLEAEDSLPEPKRRFNQCDGLMNAWQLHMRDITDAGNAVLAERAITEALNSPLCSKLEVALIQEVNSSVDALASKRAAYESNSFNTIPFDEYWKEKTALADEYINTLILSDKIINADSIQYMWQHEGHFNHIITDIPYAIDVDMMEQSFGGLADIDTIRDEHNVEENTKLIADFFPAAFHCTDDNAFVITWADQMLWQFMYDCAIKAGFAVQRWPITWKKTSQCKNACINYNTTKDTEIAIVCRKPRATIAWQPATSVVTASNEEMKKLIGHPFAKPKEVWSMLANLASIERQSILDPFAGRGSCALSLLPMNRHVYSVELNVAHYNALQENIKAYYLKLNPKFIFR